MTRVIHRQRAPTSQQYQTLVQYFQPMSQISTLERPSDTPPVLEATGLRHSFGQTEALRGVTLAIDPGEVVAVTGASGSGKSTLLHLLAGVLTPDEGVVSHKGDPLSTLGEAERATRRLHEFGFVFQFGQLLPDLTAVDNVTIPLLLRGIPRRSAITRARDALNLVDLGDFEQRLPSELSGGQAQRVAVARAIVGEPSVLFADEPTGSLDTASAERTMDALLSVVTLLGSSLVVVTHNEHVARLASREIHIRDGQIAERGE